MIEVLRGCCLAIWLCVGLVACAKSEDAGTADPSGVYTVKHEIAVTNPSNPSGEELMMVEDCLELRGVWEEQLAFSFVLHQANGHECYMQGIARPTAPGVYEFSEPTIEPERDCVLRLYVSKESIRLEDVDSNCRMGHCGARAGIETAFPRKKEAGRVQCKVAETA